MKPDEMYDAQPTGITLKDGTGAAVTLTWQQFALVWALTRTERELVMRATPQSGR